MVKHAQPQWSVSSQEDSGPKCACWEWEPSNLVLSVHPAVDSHCKILWAMTGPAPQEEALVGSSFQRWFSPNSNANYNCDFVKPYFVSAECSEWCGGNWGCADRNALIQWRLGYRTRNLRPPEFPLRVDITAAAYSAETSLTMVEGV